MLRYKILYLILLVLLWNIRFLYTFRITAIILYVFLLLPLVLFILLLIQQAGIKISLTAPVRIAEKTKPFTLYLRVENKNFLPAGKLAVRIEYRNIFSKGWTKKKLSFSIQKGEENHTLALCSDYSAGLEVRIGSAKLYSILNIFSIQKISRKKRAADTISIIVLPQIHEMEESPICVNPYVMPEGSLYSNSRSGDDSTELFDVREYMQGDRINRIHWKLTTKKDELMVKEFGLPIDCSVLVLIDTRCQYHNVRTKRLLYPRARRKELEKQLRNRDTALETALSLSYRMIQDKQIHYLAWFDSVQNRNEKIQISNIEDFYSAIAVLLGQKSQLWQGSVPLLYFSEFYKDQYSNIFYISAEPVSEECAEALEENQKSAWLSMIFSRELCQGKEGEYKQKLEKDGVLVEFVSPATIKEDLCRIAYRKGGALWDAG